MTPLLVTFPLHRPVPPCAGFEQWSSDYTREWEIRAVVVAAGRLLGTIPSVFTSLLQAIGESDCEFLSSGFLAQPVNAISGVAYAVFGVVVFASIHRFSVAERSDRLVFGSLLVATGLGTVLFHGPQGAGSQFVHDVTFLSTLLFIAVANVCVLRSWTRRSKWTLFSLASMVLAVLLLVWPGVTNVLAALSVLAIVGSDVLAHRSGTLRMRWWRGAVLAMALGLVFYVAGRSGGLLCDSSSLLQGHALWHILSAAALWAYFEATTPSRIRESQVVG